jgi:hypothetical protein
MKLPSIQLHHTHALERHGARASWVGTTRMRSRAAWMWVWSWARATRTSVMVVVTAVRGTSDHSTNDESAGSDSGGTFGSHSGVPVCISCA